MKTIFLVSENEKIPFLMKGIFGFEFFFLLYFFFDGKHMPTQAPGLNLLVVYFSTNQKKKTKNISFIDIEQGIWRVLYTNAAPACR